MSSTDKCDTTSGHCACASRARLRTRRLTTAEWGAQYRAARDALVAIAGEPTVLWASDAGRLPLRRKPRTSQEAGAFAV